jgi:hypothetical protein
MFNPLFVLFVVQFMFEIVQLELRFVRKLILKLWRFVVVLGIVFYNVVVLCLIVADDDDLIVVVVVLGDEDEDDDGWIWIIIKKNYDFFKNKL